MHRKQVKRQEKATLKQALPCGKAATLERKTVR